MQRVLIIGATSAIAQGAARVWAGRGEALGLAGRAEDRLAIVGADLEVRGASEVHTFPLDFSDTASHPAWVKNVIDQMGGLDVVVVAHGSLGDQEQAQKDYAEAERVLQVNFLSVVSLLTPLANHLEEQGRGAICVVSSVAGDRGRQSNYIYGTAKGAVNVFLQGLRNRLFKSGVHVVTVKPGFVATPMTAHLDQGPLFAQPEAVGRGIVRAVDGKRNEVYLPGFWMGIMGAIRAVPEGVFKRLSL